MFGISRSEFEVLCTIESERIIEKNIDKEPSALALKGVSAVLCNQVKYLQRCRTKIPHYYKARCIIPPLSYEQSSSDLSTLTKRESGVRLLDLTCGLGVDSYHYSTQFVEVIALEKDSLIADIAKENFRRLGVSNITVINTPCEDYVRDYVGEKFDMVYVDPARRDNSKRVFLLEDCSPDIRAMIDDVRRISKRLTIKLSPLFDIAEAERIFGRGVTLRAISVGDECKELLVEIDFSGSETTMIGASSINKRGEIKEVMMEKNSVSNLNIHTSQPIEEYRLISILDVALRKMRCCGAYYKKYHNEDKPLYDNEIALWMERTEVMGRMYEIISISEYKPKIIKDMGIKSATIIIQNFNISIEDLRKRLRIKNGSESTLIFTTINNKQYMFKVC